MARVLVYEGGYGQMGTIMKKEAIEYIKGAGIGAGTATLADFIASKVPFLRDLKPTMRNLLMLLGVAVGAAFLARKRPELAVGFGTGGGAVFAYKVIQSLLGRVVTVPTAGYSELEQNEGQPKVEIEEYSNPYGMLYAEPEELGEEYIIEEY